MMDRHYFLVVAAFLAALSAPIGFGSSAHAQETFNVDKVKYRIDRFPTKPDTKKRRTVLLIHGVDGMDGRSGRQILDFAKQLEQAGFVVFVPHYFNNRDGSSATPLPELIKARLSNRDSYLPRIAGAVDHASKQSDVDKDRLGLVGLSLGGGLAIQHAQGAPAGTIRAVVDFFGYLPDAQIIKDATKLPPTLVLHNEKDQVVPIEMSRDLVAALSSARIEHDSEFYDNGDPEGLFHPFTPGGAADKGARERTVKWLEEHLK